MSRNQKSHNILIIGDLHAPFTHKDYLRHCREVYKKFNCNEALLVGDLLDNHYSSYFETNCDGLTARDELNEAIQILKPYYKAFPEAKVTIGNHDRLIIRKAQTANISRAWIRDYNEVLQCPEKWVFDTSFVIDNVLYFHGENCASSVNTLLSKRQNIVYGHLHTKFDILYHASEKDLIWSMCVGCGIDIKRYAFEYARFDAKRPILGCGVVLNNGKLPVLVPMNL